MTRISGDPAPLVPVSDAEDVGTAAGQVGEAVKVRKDEAVAVATTTGPEARTARQRAAAKQRKATRSRGSKVAARARKEARGLAHVAADATRTAAKAASAASLWKRADLALDVVGGLATAYCQYQESTATTRGGKAADAVVAVAVDHAFGMIPGAVFIDATVDGFFSDQLATSVRGTVTVVEGLLLGDERGMQSFHSRSLAGEYGWATQKSSEAGDYWAEYGVTGGLEQAWREFASW